MSTTTPKKLEVGEEVKAAVTHATVPSKMTAAVLYGSEDLRIEKIDVPALAADEVLLRVRLALTAGTDLKVWKRGYHAKMIQPPAVFGHELVGEIVAVGKRVDSRWRIGMRVVAANSAPCLRCYHCRRGQENLCDDLLFNNGAYAEYMRIPGRIVVENMLEVPHSVDDQSAALAEPLACVLRGIHEMEVRTGDTAAVIGCGPIGLKFVRMLSRRGVRVIALARRAAPLDIAKRLGAVATFNVTETDDVVAAVKTLTEDQLGPDSVVEAAGNPATWKQALAMVRRGGVVNFFSGLPSGTRVEIDPAAIHYSEIKLISPFHHTPRFFREALEAIRRGDISARDFVTEEIRLADLPQHFYNLYAYCRWADDLGDEVPDPNRALELLHWWEHELNACYEGKPSHPVFVALRETIVAKDIPKQPFADLLKAFRQDQTIKRYPTWDAVLDYCVYSANPVGRLVLYLCGYRDEQRQRLSDATCTALQLANFWQDVSRDLEKGRIYIPLDAAAAHCLAESDLVERRFDERYVRLMKDLIARTRELFAKGRPLANMVDGRLSVDLEMFSRGGLAVLDAIKALGYDTLHHRPTVSKLKQAALLSRALVAYLGGGNPRSNEVAPAIVGAQQAAPQSSTTAAESFEASHRIARASHSNFYYAFFLLPKPKRDGLAALYAFMRLVDDVADEGADLAAKQRG